MNKQKKQKESEKIISRPRLFDIKEGEYTHDELLEIAKQDKLYLSSAEFKAIFVEKAKKLLHNNQYSQEIACNLYNCLIRFLLKERFWKTLPIFIDNFGAFIPQIIQKNKKNGTISYVLITFVVCNKLKEYYDLNKKDIIKRSLKLIHEFINTYGEIKLTNKYT